MKRRILRALAIASLATSLAGCSTISNTVNSVLKLPGSLLNAGNRSLSQVGM